MPDQPPVINEALDRKNLSQPPSRARWFVTAILGLLLCGCATEDDMKFSKGNGDLGIFILHKATEFGGQPSSSTIPVLNTQWRYSEDAEGVVIRANSKDCPSVESLLLHSFGEPRLNTTNTYGMRFLVYRLSPKGGGIQMDCTPEGTQVIILKPESSRRAQNQK